MRFFTHNLRQDCECGWSIFHKNLGGHHILHVLGLRVSWGTMKWKD